MVASRYDILMLATAHPDGCPNCHAGHGPVRAVRCLECNIVGCVLCIPRHGRLPKGWTGCVR